MHEKTPAPTIDAATGKVLNEAIELLNKEDYKAPPRRSTR